jgi:hypothetical protein
LITDWDILFFPWPLNKNRRKTMLRVARHIVFKLSVLWLAVALLAGCSSISVTNDWDTSIDFNQFKTFFMLTNEEPSINQLIDQRVRAAIVADLTAKGLQQVDDADQADLAFGYRVTTEDRTSFQTVYDGWGAYGYPYSRRSWYRGSWDGTLATSTTSQINYTVGTLVIAAFQEDSQTLVWEGTGSGVVNPSTSPEQSTQKINEAVQRIMESFPPAAAPAR